MSYHIECNKIFILHCHTERSEVSKNNDKDSSVASLPQNDSKEKTRNDKTSTFCACFHPFFVKFEFYKQKVFSKAEFKSKIYKFFEFMRKNKPIKPAKKHKIKFPCKIYKLKENLRFFLFV